MEDKQIVALYARVSSQRQAEELTIQSQIDVLKQRIIDDGHPLDEERCFLDEGYSGGTLLRPALERLRDVAYSGGIDRLYVHSPDRLSRKYAYQVLLIEELQKHAVEVVFVNHGIEQSAEGNLLLQMQGMIAEYERAKILERTRRGRRFAARQGKVSVLAHAPYGYRYVRKREGGGEARFEINRDEAGVVQNLFRWVALEGLSLGAVTRRLSEHRIPTRTGNARWDSATVRGILRNPAYHGTARYGKTRLSPRKTALRTFRGQPDVPRREKVARPTLPEEQEPIPVPALISEELFATVAEQLEENRRQNREQHKGPGFLLSGLLVCHQCGSAYCGRRQKRKGNPQPYIYYRCIGTDKYRRGGETICCNKSVNGERLDESVWSDMCRLLKDPQRLQREFQRRLDGGSRDEDDRSARQQSITQLKERVSRLVDAYENGWLEKPDFESRMRRVRERLSREEEILAEHQRDVIEQQELRLVIHEFETFAEQIKAGLSQATVETKQQLLRLLIKRIEVDADEIRIVYKVQPHPFVPSPAKRGTFLQHCLKRHNVAQGKRDAAPPWGANTNTQQTPTGFYKSVSIPNVSYLDRQTTFPAQPQELVLEVS